MSVQEELLSCYSDSMMPHPTLERLHEEHKEYSRPEYGMFIPAILIFLILFQQVPFMITDVEFRATINKHKDQVTGESGEFNSELNMLALRFFSICYNLTYTKASSKRDCGSVKGSTLSSIECY